MYMYMYGIDCMGTNSVKVPTSHKVDCVFAESLHQQWCSLLLSVAMAQLTVHP